MDSPAPPPPPAARHATVHFFHELLQDGDLLAKFNAATPPEREQMARDHGVQDPEAITAFGSRDQCELNKALCKDLDRTGVGMIVTITDSIFPTPPHP